jgi:hypothetical protein
MDPDFTGQVEVIGIFTGVTGSSVLGMEKSPEETFRNGLDII